MFVSLIALSLLLLLKFAMSLAYLVLYIDVSDFYYFDRNNAHAYNGDIKDYAFRQQGATFLNDAKGV